MADTTDNKKAEKADKELQKKSAKEKTKNVEAVCSIDIDNIFAQLHAKAMSQVKDCKIQNSAVEGDGKKANFHGAGSHIIAVLPLKGDEIDLQTALVGLKQYVTWFNGPDVANKLKEEDLISLEDNNTDDANKTQKESFDFIPSFKQFLTEEGETYKDKLDAEGKAKTINDLRSKIQKDDREQESENKKTTTAKGFYITYKITIEGQKESPLSDALKSFGVSLLKGLGIQGFSWKTGAKGKEHTIGDLVDSLSKVFGKIDPSELKSRFTKNVRAKYPQTRATDVEYYDKNTLLKHIGKKLNAKQKMKINSVDYSLCYRVPANDKTKKLINTTFVADCITRSIKGLFKKFTKSVKSDDVILVNDYDETDKDQKKIDKKLEVSKDSKPSLTSNDTRTESMNVFSKTMKFNTLSKHCLHKNNLFKLGSYIFESDEQLLSILEDETKQELIQKILDDITAEKKLVDKLKKYDGDLTGSPVEKLKTKKGDDITNDTIKMAFNNPKFGLQQLKLVSLRRISKVLDEFKKKNEDNQDIVDLIIAAYDKITTEIHNLASDDKDAILTEFMKSNKWKTFISKLKNIPKFLSKFESRDDFVNQLYDIEDRKLLRELDDAIADLLDALNVAKTAVDKRKSDNKDKNEKSQLIDEILELIENNENDKKPYLTNEPFDKEKQKEQLSEQKTKDLKKFKDDILSKIKNKKQELKKQLNGKLDGKELTDDLLQKTTVKELLSNVSNVKLSVSHSDVDFYIVPMKGLKFDNTDDDDSKEAEGKGK